MSKPGTTATRRRLTLAGTIGNVLEWYDFAVYGFLAPIMAPLFSPRTTCCRD